MMWELENREFGSYRMPGHPVRFSRPPVRAASGAPALGEHSEALLGELGYTPDEIAALKQAGIVH